MLLSEVTAREEIASLIDNGGIDLRTRDDHIPKVAL